MEAKEFLQQVKIYDTQINNKLEEVEKLKELTLKITTTLSPSAGGVGNHDKIGDAVSKIIDLEREIDEAADKFIDAKRRVVGVIEQVKNADQMNVLYKRYVQYEAWEHIACDMNFTYRNICYIHGRALQSVTEILNNERIDSVK